MISFKILRPSPAAYLKPVTLGCGAALPGAAQGKLRWLGNVCRMEFEWNQYFWEGTQQWCVLLHLDFSTEFPSLNTL